MGNFLTDEHKRLTELFSEAVKKAVEEHWAAGRTVYEWADGEVREVPPHPASRIVKSS